MALWIQGQKFRLWWIQVPFKAFLLISTAHTALIALVGIICMWQKFNTLLILALHWNTRIMHLWLYINPFGCMTEKRKTIIWGPVLNYCLNKGPVTKNGSLHKEQLRTRWRQWWKDILSLMLAASEATTKMFLKKMDTK